MIDKSLNPKLINIHNPFSSLKTENGKWMNSKELSEYLGCTEAALRNKVYRGQIPFYKLWNRLYFKKDDIDALIMASRRL